MLTVAEIAVQTAEEGTEVPIVVAEEIVIAAQIDAVTVVLIGDVTGIVAEIAVPNAADAIATAVPKETEMARRRRSAENALLWWTEKSSADSERSTI